MPSLKPLTDVNSNVRELTVADLKGMRPAREAPGRRGHYCLGPTAPCIAVALGLHCAGASQEDRPLQRVDRWPERPGRARAGLMRVDRSIHGNPGVHRTLTDGVSELKVDVGPGYRVYYAQRGQVLLLLLAGGDKSSQQDDIARAIELNRTSKD